MAPFSALRLCQNVFLPGVGASGIITDIDPAAERIKVDYTLQPRQPPRRRRVERPVEPRSDWFTPADLTLFYWVAFAEPIAPLLPIRAV